MRLSLTYDEIIRTVKEKSGQQIGIRYKDADTLTLTCEASIPIPLINRPVTHTFSADVQVVSLDLPHAVLQIDAGTAGNMALDLASQRLLSKLPAGLVEHFSGGRAVLNLDAVPRLRAFFEKMSVRQLTFYDASLSIDAELK